jgi:hypothetical protein
MREIILCTILLLSVTGCIPKDVKQKAQPVDTAKLKIESKQIVKKEVIQPQIQEVIVKKTVLDQGISTSYKVTMKTKRFAFSDTGFLVKHSDMLRLNILAMGKPVLDLKVKNSDDICVGSLCNTKHGFNQSFLVEEYPDALIENVLNKRPIFDGQNKRVTKTGFVQKITTGSYDIKYQVSSENIYFKDRKNRILIKLKRI